MESTSLGAHAVQRQGDLVKLRLFGEIGEPDIAALQRLVGSVLQEEGRCFLLADATDLTNITAEARRAMAQWGRSDPHGRASGVAIHGVSFATRTILALTVKAVRLLGYRDVVVDIVPEQTAALRSIARQRAAVVAT